MKPGSILAACALTAIVLAPPAHAADEAAPQPADDEAAAARPAAPVPPALAVRPGSSPAREADCAQLLRRYRESQECFAPYRMANGAVRPEAFVLCGPGLPDPSGQCVQVNPD